MLFFSAFAMVHAENGHLVDQMQKKVVDQWGIKGPEGKNYSFFNFFFLVDWNFNWLIPKKQDIFSLDLQNSKVFLLLLNHELISFFLKLLIFFYFSGEATGRAALVAHVAGGLKRFLFFEFWFENWKKNYFKK